MMVRALLVGLLCVAALACGRTPVAEPPTVELQDFPFGGGFTLTGQTGRSVSLSDFRGRAVLAFFGYTNCPDVCPLTMSKIAGAISQYEIPVDDVQVLFITVDVDRDTPEALAAYVKGFGVPLMGLTGTRDEVDAVVDRYRASYTITPSDSAGGPTVSHTAYTYLIDRAGKLRYVFRQGDMPEALADGLRQVLNEPTPNGAGA